MQFNELIYLIGEISSVNEYGDSVIELTERKVFAELRSVGMSEFYQAQAVGFKPEIKFVIADYLDYNNEKKLKYRGEFFDIIRTYRKDLTLELVCRRTIAKT